MFTSCRLAAILVAAACVAAPVVLFNGAAPQTTQPTVRIGVYDSRAVALAWGRSAKVGETMSKLVADAKAAQAAGDEKHFKELNDELTQRQFTMHAQGFAGFRPEEALLAVKAQMAEIAAKARVTAIVNRLDYQGTNVETVDLTDPICDQFGPSPETRRMVEQMKKAPVVSLWDATHEKN